MNRRLYAARAEDFSASRVRQLHVLQAQLAAKDTQQAHIVQKAGRTPKGRIGIHGDEPEGGTRENAEFWGPSTAAPGELQRWRSMASSEALCPPLHVPNPLPPTPVPPPLPARFCAYTHLAAPMDTNETRQFTRSQARIKGIKPCPFRGRISLPTRSRWRRWGQPGAPAAARTCFLGQQTPTQPSSAPTRNLPALTCPPSPPQHPPPTVRFSMGPLPVTMACTKKPREENMARRPFLSSFTLSSAKVSGSSARPRGSADGWQHGKEVAIMLARVHKRQCTGAGLSA